MLLNEDILLDFNPLQREHFFNSRPGQHDGYPDLNDPPKPYCEAFQQGRAKKREKLEAGAVLWKCTQYPLQGSPKLNPRTQEPMITEWWLAGRLLPEIEDRCRRLGVSLSAYTRARLAVDFAWKNNLDSLLITRLMQSVYAFVGEAKYQPFDHKVLKSRVLLMGGDEQYCVPNLTMKHITQVSFVGLWRRPG